MYMALRQEKTLRNDLQRVVETLHNEAVSVEPYADQYRRLLDNHGKMIRAALVLSFARARQTSGEVATQDRLATAEHDEPLSERVIIGAAAIEMLHLATLVHDDVLDNAPVRRNNPTTQTMVGNKVAIYLGDLILSRYMEIAAGLAPDVDFMREQSSTLREIVTGELLQESARHHSDTTVEYYTRAIGGKTAALFRLSCLTGLRLSGRAPDLSWVRAATSFGDHLGIAFQIVDDIEDFDIAHDTGKPKLEDITDGIYTLPVLLALREDPTFHRLLNDPEAVLGYLNDHPRVMIESKRVAAEHVSEAARSLEAVAVSEPIKKLLLSMLQQFSARI